MFQISWLLRQMVDPEDIRETDNITDYPTNDLAVHLKDTMSVAKSFF